MIFIVISRWVRSALIGGCGLPLIFVSESLHGALVPRPFYARGARWERDKGLVPVVRACVEFYWNPGKIVFFGIF